MVDELPWNVINTIYTSNITFVKQAIYVGSTTSVTGPLPISTPTHCHGYTTCPLSGPVRQELRNSFSDGMFAVWNTAYIHVLLNNARHGGGGTLTVFMCYGMNI